MSSPDYGGTQAINLLLGVSCVPSGFCAAVGYHNLNTRTQTLIESLPPLGSPTGLTTSLSGAGQSGMSIAVPPGSAVSDMATLSGTSIATASGTVTYSVYSNGACTISAGSGGTGTVVDGTAPASSTVTLPAAGNYYWQASYSGDATHAPSVSVCGPSGEVEAVGPVSAAPEFSAVVMLPASALLTGGAVLALVRRRERKQLRPRS